MDLVFASNNKHKLEEVTLILGKEFTLLSPADINIYEELPETKNTLEGNASQKSFYIFNKTGRNCFADDTGLEIEALGGKPGVLSARYAGPACNPEDNIRKILDELKEIDNRKAVFRCIISLVIEGREIQFEGRMEGEILKEKHGGKGFGYDPVFKPAGYTISFAEMSMEDKNLISHRAVAVRKMKYYLTDQ